MLYGFAINKETILLFNGRAFTVYQVIPVGGMVIGAMVAIALLSPNFLNCKQEVEIKLAFLNI